MHPVAWFAWLAAMVPVALLSRNPLYLFLLFGIDLLVIEALGGGEKRASGPAPAEQATALGPISPVRFAAFALPLGALFNGLVSHFGQTVLFRLPAGWPLLGGPITAEALVFGAINGLVLATLYAAFAVLTLAVPVRDLVGYLPRAFYPVAVVSAIAVTFVPSTMRQVRQVREAQAVRGHRMRGLRDWLPLFMPVLIGGLERALQLAEAMTARGFAGVQANDDGVRRSGRVARRRTPVLTQAASVVGLFCVLAGAVLRLVPDAGAWSLPLLAGGTSLVVLAVWRTGQGVHHTRYRQRRWSLTDGLAVAGAAAALTVWLALSGATRAYTPYPLLLWPGFDARVGLALAALALPAFVSGPREEA